jgi:hypothetical protein
MKFIVGLVSVAGSVAYGKAILGLMDSSLLEIPQVRAALVGFLIGAAVWAVLGRKLAFFGVFEHELTHLVFGLLMFQRPRSFYASDKKGHVTTEGGNFIDNLAPYYFPTFSYILLAVFPLLKPAAHPYFYSLLGLLTGYHLVSNVAEFGFRQSDIRRSGPLFSLVFCFFAAVLAFGFLTAFIIGGFRGGIDFLYAGVAEAQHLLTACYAALKGLLQKSDRGQVLKIEFSLPPSGCVRLIRTSPRQDLLNSIFKT